MNIVLFQPDEVARALPHDDRRAMHVLQVLRRKIGDTFDAGIVDGPRGKAMVTAITPETLSLSFNWSSEPTPPEPIALIVGLPRPQTARNILREAAALGVAALHFVTTDKGDPNYASSSLWQTEEHRRHLIAGAEQAFCTRLPLLTFGRDLASVVSAAPRTTRIALDNYEASGPFSQIPTMEPQVTVAIGSERGWSNAERECLREEGFVLAHLGTRVLRTETACIVAIALTKARLGLI
ncbi:MAG: RsmE family RNA methyltransferase [Opitutus sp.]